MENKTYKVCKICIMLKGLKGTDLATGKCTYAFNTETELETHLKTEHGIKTRKC